MKCKSCSCAETEEVIEANSCNLRKPSTANEKVKVELYLSQATIERFRMMASEDAYNGSANAEKELMEDVLDNFDW